MPGRRVILRDWIVERGRDPEKAPDGGRSSIDLDTVSLEDLDDWAKGQVADQAGPWSGTCDADMRRAVTDALGILDEDERELIVRYYYMGLNNREISELSGRAVHKLESLRQRALRKLKKELAPFVEARFGLVVGIGPDCQVCRSPHRREIEQIFARRDRRRSLKPVLDQIKKRFGLHITSPQALIGHARYHQTANPAGNTRKEKRCHKNEKPNSEGSSTSACTSRPTSRTG